MFDNINVFGVFKNNDKWGENNSSTASFKHPVNVEIRIKNEMKKGWDFFIFIMNQRSFVKVS